MRISEMQERAHRIAVDHGWWPEEGDHSAVDATIPKNLMLIVTEIAEAMECYREGQPMTWTDDGGKPQGIASELADVLIRVADLCGAIGIDLEASVLDKMAYNARRSHRHGGKRA